jgi:glutathione S-transferase
MQVPYLRDPNTGAEMFESAEIRRYLYETYADGGVTG